MTASTIMGFQVIPIAERQAMREALDLVTSLADELTSPDGIMTSLSDRLDALEDLGRKRSDWVFEANTDLLGRIEALQERQEWYGPAIADLMEDLAALSTIVKQSLNEPDYDDAPVVALTPPSSSVEHGRILHEIADRIDDMRAGLGMDDDLTTVELVCRIVEMAEDAGLVVATEVPNSKIEEPMPVSDDAKWAAVGRVVDAEPGYNFSDSIKAAVKEAHRQGLTPQPAPVVVDSRVANQLREKFFPKCTTLTVRAALNDAIAYWTAQRTGGEQ